MPRTKTGRKRNSDAAASVVFWSRGGLAPRAPELDIEAARDPAAPDLLPLEPNGRFYRGVIRAGSSGTLVLHLDCPRPLRVWVDGFLLLDEPLFWRQYEREVRAAVIQPCERGDVPFRVEVGAPQRHPASIDADCPSRNRERVMRELQRVRPDRLRLAAGMHAGCAPAASLRFLPSQYWKNGVAFQHVLIRPLRGAAAPSTGVWSAAEEPEPDIALSTPFAPLAEEITSDAERRAGLRRFGVPVADADGPLPPVREPGPESRVEPAVAIAGSIALAAHGPGGSAAMAMPVYEHLGRLAPAREFKPIAWPEAAELLRAAPEPVLPPEWAHYKALYDYTWGMLLRLVRQPPAHSGLPGSYIGTALKGFLVHQFVWDTSFTAISTRYGWRALDPYATLNVLYSRQFDGGYIHREHDVRDGLPTLYEPDFSPNPPIMTIAEWSIYRVTGNLRRLGAVYPALKAHHEWLRHNRRLPDGTYWTTGLANGLDNSPSLGDGYPCLTAQMAHHAETLGLMAAALGRATEAQAFRREHRAIGAACNKRLWSDAMDIYATSLPGGEHNPNKVVTAFWPLWAGIVPPDRVEALAQHLKDPKSFWRHHPIPSLAADSPHFKPEGNYWLGSTWAPTNYAAIKGFDRAGRHDLALEATLRHLECMHEVWRETGAIWENYCSEASRRGNWSGPDYCWTSLGPIALLLEVVLGLEADAPRQTLRWNPPPEKEIGVRRFPLGAATVSLQQRPDGAGWCVDAQTDRPFTLQLVRGDAVQTHACPVGASRFAST